MEKRETFLYLVIFLLIGIGTTAAAELKDPRLRDEDMSNMIFTVDISMRPDGLYEYVYSLDSPIENLGRLLSLRIDLTCEAAFDPVVLPHPVGAPGYDPYTYDDLAPHTPVAILGDPGMAWSYGFHMNGQVSWGIGLDPGDSVTGLRLISATEPGMRQYELVPSMWYGDESGYDYSEVDETGYHPPDYVSEIPGVDDFTIHGMIAAPGCPGVTEPWVPDAVRYAGSSKHKESESTNELLTYTSPQLNRFHVDEGTTSFAFHIHYSPDIDPDTLMVKPKNLQGYFNPWPDTSEIVNIPLKKKKTKIDLSIYSQSGETMNGEDDSKFIAGVVVEVNGKTKKPKKNKHQGQVQDRDTFEIRVSKPKK